MADFYKTQPTNDPNYLGMSKEPDRVPANKSLGELFESVGNIAGAAVKFADNQIKRNIMERSREEYDPILDRYTGRLNFDETKEIAGTGSKGRVRALQMKSGVDTEGLADGTPTYDGGTLGYAPEDAARDAKINSIFPIKDTGRELPPEAQRQFTGLERLKAAYQSGNFSKTQFDAEVYSTLKRIRTEFPGYSDEVDAAQQRFTGEPAANALRRSLMSDIQANLAAQMASANSDEKWIEKHRGEIYALGYNEKTPMEVLKPAVGQFLGTQTLQRAKELSVNVNSPEAEAVLTEKMAGISQGSLVSFGNGTQTKAGVSLADFQRRAESLTQNGADPKEQAMLVQEMTRRRNDLEIMMRQAAYSRIEGDKENRSLVGKVKDGDNKISTIIASQLKPWDQAIELVKSGSFSALQRTTDMLKYRDNRLVQNLRDNFPGADQMIAITTAFPNAPLIQNQFLTTSGLLVDFQKAVAQGLGNSILSGKPLQPAPTPSQAVDAYGKNVTPEQTNAIYKQTAKQYDMVISPENKNTENATHVAKQFFTDTTFYDRLSDDGRMKLFLQFAAPSKIEYIKKLSEKDPEVFQKAKEWALYAAGDIWRRKSDEVQVALADPRYKIEFDLKNMEFKDNTAYDRSNQWNISRGINMEQKGIQDKLNAVNAAITWLRPIVGDDPQAILPALGLNPMTLKDDQLGSIIMKKISETALKSAANAKNVVTQGVKEAGEGLQNARTWDDIFEGRAKPNPR